MTGPGTTAAVTPALTPVLACAGCGFRVPDGAPLALRCPLARPGDNIDHVLTRVLGSGAGPFPAGDEANPFVRYRSLFHAYHVARSIGWSDADYVALVERLDRSVARVDGHGFRVTPFARSDELSARLGFSDRGGAWVKDETGTVSGSHKARHLFGTLLELEVEAARAARGGSARVGSADAADAGTAPAPGSSAPLAIASCGNAALAAAVVARAAGRPLDVFIPTDADSVVVARLRDLGARLVLCERQPGVPGDPTYHRLLDALAAGAVPFTCQGNLNGLAIEGGETLGWEIAATIGRADRAEMPGGRGRSRGPDRLDRLFVQVGGGALASSCVRGLAEARDLGAPFELPRLHTVQTRGAYPLARAHERVLARVAAGESIEAALAFAAHHRSAFMWPWEDAPRSIAHGILDDETYDWLAVVRGMLETGGVALVVDEETLVEANELAVSATGIDADETGTSGLAGLLALVRAGEIGPDESVAVLFTGARRRVDPAAARPADGPPSRPADQPAAHDTTPHPTNGGKR